MTGIIITGHCRFASGLTGGLRLLAGELKGFGCVDFAPDKPVDTFRRNLIREMEALSGCGCIIIFTDIAGGTPCNVGMELMADSGTPLKIISGVNLPMLLFAYLERDMHEDMEGFLEDIIKNGTAGMNLADCLPELDSDEIETD